MRCLSSLVVVLALVATTGCKSDAVPPPGGAAKQTAEPAVDPAGSRTWNVGDAVRAPEAAGPHPATAWVDEAISDDDKYTPTLLKFLGGERPALARCLVPRLADKPTLKQLIDVEIEMDAEGHGQSVVAKAAPGSTGDAQVVACVDAHLKTLTFPPPGRAKLKAAAALTLVPVGVGVSP